MALSFADDIRPLFRDSPDIDSMKDFGLDLSSYAEVKAQAGVIYARLADGSMPCDDPWPQEQIELFKPCMDGRRHGAARAPTATGPCSAFSSTRAYCTASRQPFAIRATVIPGFLIGLGAGYPGTVG
jgi:hypothetical protein